MKAAVVRVLGAAPTYGEFPPPVPDEGEYLVTVTASALTNFTRLRATGAHPSFVAKAPFVPGIDGVGRLADGRRVYFLFPRAPYGGMAEQTVVTHIIPLPDEVDAAHAAAIADPGMSAWVALESRAKLQHGETVLVNGATGAAGSIAVQIARHLGAGRVIATGRNAGTLATLGADETIVLTGHETCGQADVVLDYLWGPSAKHILASRTQPTRFIQIGTAAAPTIALNGSLLRASPLVMMGSGIGSVSIAEIRRILTALMRVGARFTLATRSVSLSEIEQRWSGALTPRLVFITSRA